MCTKIMSAFIVVAVTCASVASADSIKVGDKTYEGVYISEGASCYYVSIPEDGTVVNVPKSDVDAQNVSIMEDREARKALYNKWSEKRRELKGAEDVLDTNRVSAMEVTPPPAPDTTKEDEAPVMKTVSASGKKADSSSGSTSSVYASGQNYSDEQRYIREAQIAARRRQRESDKIRSLTERRVYTSQDAGSGGGYGGRGGSYGGGGGGSYGGGGYGGGGYGGGGGGGSRGSGRR